MNFLDAIRSRSRSAKLVDAKSDCYQRHRGLATALDCWSSYVPAFMEDDNDATQWVSNTWIHTNPGVVWAKMDLGSSHVIMLIRIYLLNGTQYKLEGSDDNSNYYLVYTSPAGLGVGADLAYIPSLKYRYWRCTHLDGGTYGWQISSFDLFGPNQ